MASEKKVEIIIKLDKKLKNYFFSDVMLLIDFLRNLASNQGGP